MITSIALFIIGVIFFVVTQVSKWEWYAQCGSHKTYWTGIVIGLICMLVAIFG